MATHLRDALARVASQLQTRISDPTSSATPDRLEPPPCPTCSGTGWVKAPPTAADPQARPIPCPVCQANWQREQLRRTCGLAPLEWEHTFERFSTDDNERRATLLDAARAFVAGVLDPSTLLDADSGEARLNWLALLGPPGTGKSHLLHAVCVALVAASQPVRVVVVPDLWAELRSAIDEKDGSPDAAIRDYAKYPVLLLDEVAEAEGMTPWQRTQFDWLVNARYRDRLPTLFTSNHPLTAIPQRAADRMAEGEVLTTTGLPSWRRRAR